jgi:hypothetical protein
MTEPTTEPLSARDLEAFVAACDHRTMQGAAFALNLTQSAKLPVHPDPFSGMRCWHQKVRVRPAEPGDEYGDVFVDFMRARNVYRKWLALTRPAIGELRRPIWLFRPVKPALSAYALPDDDRTRALRDAEERAEPVHPDAFADLVDWDSAVAWGPLGPGGSGR